jgi:hypothetical protein
LLKIFELAWMMEEGEKVFVDASELIGSISHLLMQCTKTPSKPKRVEWENGRSSHPKSCESLAIKTSRSQR